MPSQRVFFPHLDSLLKFGCCQADSPIVRLGDFSFESCTTSFEVSLCSLPFCEGTAPKTSFGKPMLHDVNLVDVQTSGLPNCFSLCHRRRWTHIRQHNSHVFRTLGAVPSSCRHNIQEREGLATTECSNLVHASLCAHVEVVTPVGHTKEDSVLPSCFDSCHTLPDPGIKKRSFPQNAAMLVRFCPLAQLTSCLAVWISPASVHHRNRVFRKPKQDWV